MDIQSQMTTAVAAGNTPGRAEKSKDATEAAASTPAFFSLLLQGAQVEMQEPIVEIDVTLLSQSLVNPEMGDALGMPENWMEPGWSVESLVGQTQHLDSSDVDRALQDGSLLLQRQEAGLSVGTPLLRSSGAQLAVPVGDQLATVAAGVQAMSSTLQSVSPQAAALSSVVLGEIAAQVEPHISQSGETSSGLLDTDGRVLLQGAWNLDDPQMAHHPTVQRALGQVEQWAVAAGGFAIKNAERQESVKTAVLGMESLSNGHASGTRLTDVAVQEAQQSQSTQGETQTEAPVEDMRFWLQGKQQRAEVVMDRDGQPVRVQVTLRGNEAHVAFHAAAFDTREMLDGSVAQLREMLQQQGVELAGVSVHAESQGQASGQGNSQHSPWQNAAPTLHAQVVVPDAAASVVQRRPSQGLSLYA